MSFDSIVAGINGGTKRHWFKCDEASGNLIDAGTGADDMDVFVGAGSLTYQVTGSETGGTTGDAISHPGNRSAHSATNSMATADTFSSWFALKTINNAANAFSSQCILHAVASANNQQHVRLYANRNSDSNGAMVADVQRSAGNLTQSVVLAANHPGAWDDDLWHYYAIVQRKDGNGLQFYIDGVLVTQTQSTGGVGSLDDSFDDSGLFNAQAMALMSDAESTFTNTNEGVADNFLYWHDYALTAQEVLDLFNESTPITTNTRRKGRRVYNDAL